MKKILFKCIYYLFFISVVGLVILLFANIEAMWAKVLKCIFLGYLVIAILFLSIVLLIGNREERQISEYLNNNEYDSLIEFCNYRLSKKHSILSVRKNYYEYLILLSYVAKNDEEKMVELFDSYTDYDSHSIVYYWKACYEFSKNNYENIKDYYNKYINNPNTRYVTKHASEITSAFYSLTLFADNKIDEAKEYLKKGNMDKLTMPCAINAIKIINDATSDTKGE